MNATPTISLIHPTARVEPSASFPHGWRDAAAQFMHSCDRPQDVEYVIVVHASRWAAFWLGVGGNVQLSMHERNVLPQVAQFCCGDVADFGRVVAVRNDGRDCVVDQINAGCAASTGKLLLGMMDDLEAPEHWDRDLLMALACGATRGTAGLPPTLLGLGSDSVPRAVELGTELCGGEWVIDLTGEPSNWIVYSALTRARFERYGYCLHPDFVSMYADNYYSDVAHRDGVVIDGRGIGFKHRHFTNSDRAKDAVYDSQNAPALYFTGRNTYARLTGQPLQKAIAICLPGEWFQADWVAMWSQLFGHLTQNLGMMAMPFFGHSSNVYCTRMELAQGVIDCPVQPDYVLWIDDDNKLGPEGLDRLLRTLEESPDLAGVVGWCWCDNHQSESYRLDKWTMSVGKQGPNMECFRFTPEDLKGLGPVITSDELGKEPGMGFWSGFPCVLMRFAALAELGPVAFAPVQRPDIKFGFSGEDTAFFWNARRAGQKWAVDLRVKLPHVKWRAIEPVLAPVAAQAEGCTA